MDVLKEIKTKYGYTPWIVYSGKCKDGREFITFRDKGRFVVAMVEKGKLRILTDMAEEDVDFLLYEVIGRPRPDFIDK